MIIKYHIVYFLLKGDIMTHKMNKNLEKNVWDIEHLGKQYPMFTTTHQYLMKKYNKNDLSVDETLFEIKMSPTDFYEKKKIEAIPVDKCQSLINISSGEHTSKTTYSTFLRIIL